MDITYNTQDDYLKALYFRDVKDYPLLTAVDERKLIQRAQAGDLKAQSKLVLCNQRFIIDVALKYKYGGLPLMDIINEANIGLIKAIYKYDLKSKNIRFLSYAIWWIRQVVIKAVYEKSRVVSLPFNISTELRKIYSLQSKGKTITDISKVLNISEEQVQTLIAHDKIVCSIDAPIGDGGQQFIDIIPNPDADDPQKNVGKKCLRNYIEKKLSSLPYMEHQVIKHYFGFNNHDVNYNLEDLGKRYNLTRERIRQIKKSGLKKLRNICAANDVDLEGIF